MLTHERLLEYAFYDPVTGFFRAHAPRYRRPNSAGRLIGSAHTRGYLSASIDGSDYLLHRLAWFYIHGEWPRFNIDHINGVTADNRLCNLRDVPQNVNVQNQRRPSVSNTSGFLGVGREGKRFSAKIKVNRVVRYLGAFDTPEEAYAAYVAAKRVLHVGCTL